MNIRVCGGKVITGSSYNFCAIPQVPKSRGTHDFVVFRFVNYCR